MHREQLVVELRRHPVAERRGRTRATGSGSASASRARPVASARPSPAGRRARRRSAPRRGTGCRSPCGRSRRRSAGGRCGCLVDVVVAVAVRRAAAWPWRRRGGRGRVRVLMAVAYLPWGPAAAASWLRFCSAIAWFMPFVEFRLRLVDGHVAAHLVVAPAAKLGADQLVTARRGRSRTRRGSSGPARRPA